MDVYKRADGRSPFWQYDLTLPDGTRQRCSTKETNKAKARRKMLDALQAAKDLAEAPKVSPVLYDIITAYIEHLRADGKVWAYDAETIRNKLFGTAQFATAERFKLPMGLRVNEIDGKLLMDLRAARIAEGSSAATRGHELKVMRAAVNLSAQNGEAAPVIKWDVPATKSKKRWLTPEEWKAIYDELNPHRPMKHRSPDTFHPPSHYVVAEREQTRDLFVALSLCGGRWGEVTRLTTDTILPGGSIRLYGRKTGKERIVPLPPLAAEAMERRRVVAEEKGTVYLFQAGGTSGKRPGKAHVAVEWQKGSGAIMRAFERAKVNAPHKVERDGKASAHSLRHTFASWCLQSGMDLSEVQELLGHATITQTMCYAHLATGKAVEKARVALGGIVEGVMAA